MRRFVQRLTCKRLGIARVKLRRYGFSLMALSLTLFTCCLLSSSVTAQTTTSTIEGVITDANGAVITGAEVKASGVTLASERETLSDSQGFYRFTALPAGAYTVTVSRAGFRTSTANIEVTLNRVASFDGTLQVRT